MLALMVSHQRYPASQLIFSWRSKTYLLRHPNTETMAAYTFQWKTLGNSLLLRIAADRFNKRKQFSLRSLLSDKSGASSYWSGGRWKQPFQICDTTSQQIVLYVIPSCQTCRRSADQLVVKRWSTLKVHVCVHFTGDEKKNLARLLLWKIRFAL